LRWPPVPLWLEISAGVLLVLLVSNGLTLAITEQRRVTAVSAERLQALEMRMGAFLALYRRLPAGDRHMLETLAGAQYERLGVGRQPRVAADSDRDYRLEDRVRQALSLGMSADVRLIKRGRPGFHLFGRRHAGSFERYAVAVALDDGRWLNGEFYWPIGGSPWPGILLAGLASAVLLLGFSFWIARRLARPLNALVHAAQSVQNGEAVRPVRATGPAVLHEAVDEFNRMLQRLLPLVEAQTTVLASVGHDLRSPLTALRLKSEFVDDEALRQSLSGCIDEIQSLTEAALQVVRGGVGSEVPRVVDLAALVSSLCEASCELGQAVIFLPGPACRVHCRPDELRRAVRNLVENAVKHAGNARVAVVCDGDMVQVIVDDDGAGLPDAVLEEVFQPFRRLAGAGVAGHGLGLSLARTIARVHGGDVRLCNREAGGLRAVLSIAGRAADVGRLTSRRSGLLPAACR
jgi:signal transduction histidine kinase